MLDPCMSLNFKTLEVLKKLGSNTNFNNEKGCWIWLGQNTGRNRYGKIQFSGRGSKAYLIHRLSAHIFHDLDLEGELFALHKNECHETRCWNPDHLYIGNKSDNAKDAFELGTRSYSPKQYCKNGHKLENGPCQICRKEYMKKYNKNHYLPHKFEDIK